MSHLLYVLFGTAVGWLHDGPHHLGVTADDQCLIRGVGVDAHPTLTDYSVLHHPTLPQGVSVHLKLTGVGSLEEGDDSRRQRFVSDTMVTDLLIWSLFLLP